MGNELRLSRFDPEGDDPEVVQRVQRRAANRRIFREMVKGEINDGRLTHRRRRELIQFAAGLEIDDYEARLLLRAVEYECCVAGPAQAAGLETPTDAGRLLAADESSPLAAFVLVGLTIIIIAAMALRALSAMSF